MRAKDPRPPPAPTAYRPPAAFWKQHDDWKAMMNVWLISFVQARYIGGKPGVDPERLQAALRERDRLAVQCREMWGPKVPSDRKPIADVLAGMMTQLESCL